MLASKDLDCENIRLILEQEPIENNKITLDDKKDKFEIPKVRLIYKTNIHTIRTAKLFLETLLEHTAIISSIFFIFLAWIKSFNHFLQIYN